MGHVIVVGNEKGGAGKSTLSVHIAVACAISGLKVAALDLDRRQRTFERYFENRSRWSKSNEADLATPDFFFLTKAAAERRDQAEAEETAATQALIAEMRASHD
ncbi:MAG TPA: ATPase, partial [Hyphomonadaceae bacterium]|nr:ATPase [Hyphomonadaceae bacterium]